MKKLIIGIILFFLGQIIWANDVIVKRKTYSKEYIVQNNTTCVVYSNYGTIKYEIGNTDRIKYFVEVVVDGKNESNVDKKLNSISLQFNTKNNKVFATTKFESMKVNNVNVKVNYTITLPATSPIELSMNYGDIYLPNTQAEVNLHLNYSDILGNPQLNHLKFSGNYCDMKGGMSVEEAEISSNYSDFKFNSLQRLLFSGNYTDLTVYNLTNNASIKGNYCDFKILKIDSIVQTVNASGNYCDFIFTPNQKSHIKVEGNYCDATYPSQFKTLRYINKNSQFDLEIQNAPQPTTFIHCTGNYNDIKIQ